MSETTTVVKALELLDGLEPDDIAHKFEDMDVKGCMGFSTQCPVAEYLRMLTEKNYSVGLYAVFSTNSVKNGYPEPDLNRHIVYLPTNIRNFVIKFDHSEYPNLIKSYEDIPHPSDTGKEEDNDGP